MNGTATKGSFLAVMRDGTHITHSSYYFRRDEFKRDVRHRLYATDLADVLKFYYDYGTESQEYTPGDVAEVFFGD